jgi:hypothetical protein
MSEETWVVRGSRPVMWTVPFYVAWTQQGEARLIPAIHILAKHLMIINEYMATLGRQEGNEFVLDRRTLEMVAEHVNGDPEHFFSWESPRLAQQPQFAPEKRIDRDEFLDALYQKGVGISRDEIEFYWNMFCKHAQDWLINKERPVDLYFLKLHNCPLRANWRYALITRFPRIGRVLSHLTGERQEYFTDQCGLSDFMVSLDLLAVNPKERTCYRYVEVEHSKTWWKNVEHVERQRKRLLGEVGYCRYFLESVRRFYKVALRLYVGWLASIARPSGTVRSSTLEGEPIIYPHQQAWYERPSGREARHVPLVVHNQMPDWTPPSLPKDLFEEEGDLSGVPTIRPNGHDMRDRGGHAAKPTNGES